MSQPPWGQQPTGGPGQQPPWGQPQPGFGGPQPGFGGPQPGFGGPQPGFGGPQPGFGGPPQFQPVKIPKKFIKKNTQKMFNQFDQNRNKTLDYQECSQALIAFYQAAKTAPPQPQTIQQTMVYFDKDKNGKFNKNEFKQMVMFLAGHKKDNVCYEDDFSDEYDEYEVEEYYEDEYSDDSYSDDGHHGHGKGKKGHGY